MGLISCAILPLMNWGQSRKDQKAWKRLLIKRSNPGKIKSKEQIHPNDTKPTRD